MIEKWMQDAAVEINEEWAKCEAGEPYEPSIAAIIARHYDRRVEFENRYIDMKDTELRREVGATFPAVDREISCDKTSDRGLSCTRKAGHDGPHVAHVAANEAAQIWQQGANPR